jgi:ribosomal protein S18 acetylase RimI-like enzyme
MTMIDDLCLETAAALNAPRIRAAEAADHAVIRATLRAAYRQYSADIPAELWCPYLDDLLDLDGHARHGELLVAVVDGEIAGYAAFYPDATIQGAGWPPGWAGGRGLAVHPDFRGHGVAGALLAELERRAFRSGASTFAFHTSAFMTAAVALYERLGYRRAPEFDLDVAALYDVPASRPWPALAYLRRLPTAAAA